MKKHILIIILIFFIITLSFTFSGCKGKTPLTINAKLSEEGVNEISVDESYKIYNSNEKYLFVDVRSVEEYIRSHVKDAILIPVEAIEESLDVIPKDSIIITYCNGQGCDRSSFAAQILIQNGYSRVYRMVGLGIFEWIDKGYPADYAVQKEE